MNPISNTLVSSRRHFLQQLGFGAAGIGLFSVLPVRSSAASAFATKDLPRSTPEAQGVSSAGIMAFLDAIAQSKHEFHSVMILRHGKVIAEGWWNPYGPEYNHTMYSMSKSFTSTAVGFAVSEKRLTVNDRVVSFFPDSLPEKPSDHLQALRVKDLLTMSVGSGKDTTGSMTASEDWVKTFLALPIPNTPGSVFLYNSGATYMLSAIVQKLTGERVVDYLKPRLFEPLGIAGMTWETCPRGINTGGWGLNIRTEGLARFGQTYLQKGMWQGKQVIPAAWVEEATAFKIQQPKPAKGGGNPDWLQGYAYQFWRCTHGGFRGDGAFGQFTIVLPEQDAVIAITSESPNMQGELDLVWEHLLPAMKNGPLPVDVLSGKRLQNTLATLALAPEAGGHHSPVATNISGKQFAVAANDLGIQSVSFQFKKESCTMTAHTATAEHPVTCGFGKWIAGETAMPGTPPKLVSTTTVNKTKTKVTASGAWKDDSTLALMWRFYETPHHDAVQCKFSGDEVQISFMNSIAGRAANPKDKRTPLTGKLAG